MAQRILRPMEYGDILDEMFDLYKKNFLLFAGIVGVVHLPVNLVVYALGGQGAGLIVAAISWPLQYVVLAAATWAVSQRYLDRETTILESYAVILRRILPFIGTMLLAVLGILLGLVFLIIPGIILMFWFAFISEVFVIEDRAWFSAMRRSREMIGGNALRWFVLSLLSGLIMLVGSSVLTAPFLLAGFAGTTRYGGAGLVQVLYGMSQGLSQTLTMPIQVIALVLLYYDIRVRKEGFDLELLAANLAGGSEASPPDSQMPEQPVS